MQKEGIKINYIYQGDCLTILKTFPDESIDCVVTSPPYYGLRDYGVEKQIGLEETPDLFIKKLVEIFREVKRVLKKQGTFWLNLGDSYSNLNWKSGKEKRFEAQTNIMSEKKKFGRGIADENLPSKSLMGIPWRVAFALQKDGWILRQDIIWSKLNPMPESVTDRCTKSHEYIFLFAKNPRYYFNSEEIKEPVADTTRKNWQSGSRSNGLNTDRNDNDLSERSKDAVYENRNKRSVWTITTKPYKEAHFATFPQDLIIPMIKAGCPPGGDSA